MSFESLTFENPFREGGKLSRDAEDIVLAIKSGKFSVTKQDESGTKSTNDEHFKSSQTISNYEVSSDLVKPCNRKNAVIQNNVSKNVFENHERNSDDNKSTKKNNQECCVLS